LHILPTPEDRLLVVDTEHYFHACLEQAIRLRSRQAFAENPPQPPFFKGGGKESTLSFEKERSKKSTSSFEKERGKESTSSFEGERGQESTLSFEKEGSKKSTSSFEKEGGKESTLSFEKERSKESIPPFEKGGLGGDLILLTGDLALDPCLASYRRILTSIDACKTPCICLPGNHDDYALMQQVFNTDKINCRKQVLLGNWQLICLNSQVPGEPGGHLASEELDFLENCLNENPDCHALIAIHHHCLETKSPWMDTMIIDNRQDILAIADKFPQVKVITTGHIHQVMDIKTATCRVLGAPSTCFQFTPESPEFSVSDTAPGYRLIDLYADGRVESEVVRLPEPLIGLQVNRHGY
ncbi:MAG: metallophosphoesterase, partial [Methylobacter sp.]|nr:metallophosphoesterase [Methylobacter sp.]